MFNAIRNFARKNTSLMIALGLGLSILLIFLPIIVISIRNTVHKGEIQFSELEIERTANILQHEVDRTYKNLGDWSSWNDTYDFALDQNEAYIENNLYDDTFKNLEINQIVILDRSNQIIFDGFYDLESQTQTESPIDLQALFEEYPVLLTFDGTTGHKGFGFFQGHAMILTSNPILTSLNEGPAAGILVFIKYLDDNEIQQLSALTLRTLKLIPVDSISQEQVDFPSYAMLKDSVVVKAVDQNIVAGYCYLPDIQKEPKLVLEVSSPRYLYQQGNTYIFLITLVLFFLDIFFSIIVYLFTNSILATRERRKDEDITAKLLEKTRQNAVELERRVEERTRELESKNKDLEDFNYSVSHDLKSPLRGISGFTSILLSDYSSRLDQTGLSYLKNIMAASSRMNTLIEDLLNYTRSERHEIINTEIDLPNFFDGLLLYFQKDIQSRKIIVEKEFQCQKIIADREALTIIFRNLLDNAIKFTDKVDAPKIRLSSEIADGDCVIAVSDNGIGFKIQFHDKIFELFQRLHLNEDYPGTGIGLALVKKSVLRLGGKIYASSEPGIGANFFVDIPVR